MDEFEFHRLLEHFAVVRTRDYHVNHLTSLCYHACDVLFVQGGLYRCSLIRESRSIWFQITEISKISIRYICNMWILLCFCFHFWVLYAQHETEMKLSTSLSSRNLEASKSARNLASSKSSRNFETSKSSRNLESSKSSKKLVTSKSSRNFTTSRSSRNLASSRSSRKLMTSKSLREFVVNRVYPLDVKFDS